MPVRSRPEDDLMNMNTSKKQEGYVVIVVAALLAALTGFLALAVDIGVLYSARTSAQEVADAAALAGAFTFSPYYPDSPQPQTASNHALRVALNHSVLGAGSPHRYPPGDFYAIDLPGSSGGSDYRENIATCINTYVRCGDFYSVKTGNMVGPTKQGVQDLIGNPPTDAWVSIGQYQTPYRLSDTSRNVIVAPIWDTGGMAGFCPDGKFPAGSTVTVQVIGF